MTRHPRLLLLLPLVLWTACGPDGGDDTATGLGASAFGKSHGGVTEACDGLDNNADGVIDEDCGQCDYLTTRGVEFWSHNQCTVTGGALGFPLLPITLGANTYSVYSDLRTFLVRPSGTIVNLALGQQIAVAKLNIKAFNLGDTLYIDFDGDGVADTVSALVAAAESAYVAGTTLRRSVFLGYVSGLNNVGATLPLYFDPSCVLPPEICDGIDNNGDGRTDETCGCLEICDGFDNDDDGAVDEGGPDVDGDGHGCDDCNDANPAIHPGAPEWLNGVDDDCNGLLDDGLDGDLDGYVLATGDCNDTDAAVHPGATERCNGVDDNCDHQVDEGATSSWYLDADGDGQGRNDVGARACTAPAGYVASTGDCDDANANVHTGATEVCDAIDDDCDGTVDEGLTTVTRYRDADGDGFGATGDSVIGCAVVVGYVDNGNDCDDSNAAAYPAAREVCDGVDNDCNSAVDEGVSLVWFLDADGDGEGGGSPGVIACTAPTGYLASGGDCDDTRASVHHGAAEVCDGLDDNCDGAVDEGTALTYFRDADGDSYGTSASSTTACSVPAGYASNSTDCDDTNAGANPAAAELCNGVDDDCNGTADDGINQPYFRDADNDTFGNRYLYVKACAAPSGYTTDKTDCDDASSSVHPGGVEIPADGIDQDCDGSDAS